MSSQPDSGTQKDSGGSRKVQLASAIIAVLGGIIVALIYTKPWVHNNPCNVNLTITSPQAGQHLSGSQGVEVTGTACDMNGLTGWLFDYDHQGQRYYMDDPANSRSNTPIVVDNGGWAYDDAPIGSPGDKNQTYGIAVVLASSSCTNDLEAAKPDHEGNIKFKTLPSGCQVEDSVDVVVTYP